MRNRPKPSVQHSIPEILFLDAGSGSLKGTAHREADRILRENPQAKPGCVVTIDLKPFEHETHQLQRHITGNLLEVLPTLRENSVKTLNAEFLLKDLDDLTLKEGIERELTVKNVNKERFLREAHRVLVPRGLITVVGFQDLTTYHKLFSKTGFEIIEGPRKMTKEEIKQNPTILKRINFEIERHKNLPLGQMIRLSGTTLNDFFIPQIIIARKK